MDYISELRKNFKNVKREGKNIRVGPCPFNGYVGVSGRPLSINIFGSSVPVGTYHCWECGESGSWNKLANIAGLKKFNKSNDLTSESERLLSYHNELQQINKPTKFDIKPWHGSWRGVSEKVLKQLNAVLWINWNYKRTKRTKRIRFPVFVNEDEIAYFGGKITEKEISSRWKNSAGSWTKTHGFWPFDIVTDSKIVVPVEGPFDSLWLIQNGIPGLTFFGTQNWNKKKVGLLVGAGIEYVIPLPDNDKPGKELYDKMIEDLKEDFEVIKFKYEAKDPGKMEKKDLKRLRNITNEYIKKICNL